MTALWQETDGLTAAQADHLAFLLGDVGLVTLDPAADTIAVHDVIRSFAVGELGNRAAAAHACLVGSVAAGLPEAPSSGDATRRVCAWWTLEDDQLYLRQNLPSHLVEAEPGDEAAAALVTDLRWVLKKLQMFGVADVVADLALVATERAGSLRRVINSSADLLAPD